MTSSCSKTWAVPSSSSQGVDNSRAGAPRRPDAASRRPYLKLGAAWSAREGNHIADVRNACDEHQHAFEAEAEAGVWHSSITTQIKVPFVIGRIHVVPPHIVLQQFQPFFTLAAADDLANAWHQQIDGRNGSAIIVGTHVKGFDFLGKIKNRDRTFKMFFGEPALMLRLQI